MNFQKIREQDVTQEREDIPKKCFCGSDSLDPNFLTISEFIHIVTVVAI